MGFKDISQPGIRWLVSWMWFMTLFAQIIYAFFVATTIGPMAVFSACSIVTCFVAHWVLSRTV